jgi:hypothetical protein
MTSCNAITKNNGQCSRAALKTGYCKQHDKDYKIDMYKKELKRMHQRMRTYSEKTNHFYDMINDVQRCDWIKSQLTLIGGERKAFRFIASDIRFKDELESLFDLPFDEVLPAYLALVTRRNEIVHKFTMGDWVQSEIPKHIKYVTRFKRSNIHKRDVSIV